MRSHVTIVALAIMIATSVLLVGMLASFAGTMAAFAMPLGLATTELVAFSGAAAAMLLPISVEGQ